MGTQRFRSLDAGSFRITEAWFPAAAVLERHTHDRASLAVMLGGGFRTDIVHRPLDCDAGFAWTEPRGEIHSNTIRRDGAHVVVVQPVVGDDELLEPIRHLFDEVHLFRRMGVSDSARRIAGEIAAPDALGQFCLEALAVTLVADAARLHWRDGNGHRLPAWLVSARDLLHEGWRRGVTLSEVARTVGVHQVHLTRSFRRYYGQSVGTYVRQLRLHWAVEQLADRDRQISAISASAGFSDQSHFTRECRRHFGFTPAEYRRHQASACLPDAPRPAAPDA